MNRTDFTDSDVEMPEVQRGAAQVSGVAGDQRVPTSQEHPDSHKRTYQAAFEGGG